MQLGVLRLQSALTPQLRQVNIPGMLKYNKDSSVNAIMTYLYPW